MSRKRKHMRRRRKTYSEASVSPIKFSFRKEVFYHSIGWFILVMSVGFWRKPERIQILLTEQYEAWRLGLFLVIAVIMALVAGLTSTWLRRRSKSKGP